MFNIQLEKKKSNSELLNDTKYSVLLNDTCQ